MWPFRRRAPLETRQDGTSYTDVVVRALVAAATGEQQGSAAGTAALELCANIYAKCFAAAVVHPMNDNTMALKPSLLANVVREMLTRGESMYSIRIGTAGRVQLFPVGSWDIRGGDSKDHWHVRIDTYGPTSSSTTNTVSYADVLHFMWSYDSALPWVGVGPASRASVTARLLGGVEKSLGDEAAGPVGSVIPVPHSPAGEEDDDPLSTLMTDITKLRGKTALVETLMAGHGEGRIAAPQHDWQPRRIGPDPPRTLPILRHEAALHLIAAAGVPIDLVVANSSAQRRESMRSFLTTQVIPLGEMVAEELREKLEQPDLRLDFSAVTASDIASRARAVRSMVDAGIELPSARRLAGLEGGV